MRSYLLGILSIIIFTCSSPAQDNNKFHVSYFSTENGLPSNGVKGLQWDDQTGFLWIATEAGIVRYNGMEFKTYSSDDNPNINNERILFLVRNNAGRIFSAETSGNIFYVEKNELKFLEKQKIINNIQTNVATLAVSEQLYHTKIDFSPNGPYSLQFDKILSDNDSSGFILHYSKLYYISVSTQKPAIIPTLFNKIGSVFRLNNNFFIKDQDNNYFLFNKKTYDISPVTLADESGNPLLLPGMNRVMWENGMTSPILFSGSNAYLLSYENAVLKATLICNAVPEDILIKYVQYDARRKTLFIGTDSKGVVIINQNRVKSLRANGNVKNQRSSYYAQVELPDGNILTNEGHVVGENNNTNETLPITGRFHTSVYVMNDSLLWYMKFLPEKQGNYLHCYNSKTSATKVYDKISFGQLVMTNSGNDIFFSLEQGIFKLAGDTLVPLYTFPDQSNLSVHYDMKEIEPGVLAIATCNSLLRYNTRTVKLDTIFNSANYCVRTIWQYKGFVFFGTYGGGLYVYKGGKVKSLPLDKNKYLLFTHCFVNDNEGFCWISTNKGLFKTSLAELMNAAANDNASVYYYYLGRNDGMEMTELNGGCMPCALKMRSGTISFPSMDGLLWVNPSAARLNLPDGEIYIDAIIADSSDVSAEKNKIILPAETADITFRLAYSAWCNKENLYIDYQLNDSLNWKTLNTDNGSFLHFSNLPSGEYFLRFRKRNGFGVNNYTYKTILFRITTPWYKKWWFSTLTLLLLAGMVLLYVQIRTRQLKRNQQRLEKLVAEKTKELQEKNEVLEKNDSIKTRLISIISHDIVTPLKFLTAAGKNLIEKRKQMPEDLQEETLTEMVNTSQELQMLSTNILNWIKYQNENRRLARETFNLHEMVQQVLGLLLSLARQKKLRIENRVPADMEIQQYYEPLKILVYNLLTNAIHFSEKGTIAVEADKTNEQITVSVRDEGAGMTQEQIQRLMGDEVVITSANIDNKKGHGLGYLIIKDLLKMMEASFSISSKKNEGTTVTFIFPQKK